VNNIDYKLLSTTKKHDFNLELDNRFLPLEDENQLASIAELNSNITKTL